MAINTKRYIEKYLKIRDKNAKVIPFKLNQPQCKLYEAIRRQAAAGKPVRVIILKARQMGFSTLTEAMIFKRTSTKRNITSAIVAHQSEATNNLFEMSKRFYSELPPQMQPEKKASNAKELVFNTDGNTGLNSRIKVFTAGGDGIGRSDTLQNLHISELAFWPGDVKATMTGLMQAVPQNPDTMVIIESTANGFDYFKKLWDSAVAGESDYIPVFCAWWELDEYRRQPEPDFKATKEEEEIRAVYKLDDAQISWRRWAIKNLCGGDIEQFRQEYPACPEEAFITTGKCVFDKAALTARLAVLQPPLRRVCFTYRISGETLIYTGMQDDERGPVVIYDEPRPGVPYVLGGDTAGDGCDNFAGQVLDNTTGAQAAVLCQKFDEDEYARQMMCLGYYYNTALLGIEVNFSTFPVKECTRLGYPAQYTREAVDTYTGKLQRKFGFRTDSRTRPELIAELVQMARDAPENLRDAATIREMLVFVKNERGRAEAMQGEHDDLVMALGIANRIRSQQSSVIRVQDTIEEKDEFAAQQNGIDDFLNYGNEW